MSSRGSICPSAAMHDHATSAPMSRALVHAARGDRRTDSAVSLECTDELVTRGTDGPRASAPYRRPSFRRRSTMIWST